MIRTVLAAAALAVAATSTAPATALPGYDLEVNCQYTGVTRSNGRLHLVLVAAAVAHGPAVPLYTEVTCTAANGTQTLTATGGISGPVAVAANDGEVDLKAYTTCVSAYVVWLEPDLSTHTTSTPAC
jgi:hypothetical protein